jgi:hypothetical protein
MRLFGCIVNGIHSDLSHADYLATEGYVSSSLLKRHLPEHYRPFNGSPSADIGSVLHARFTGDDTPVTVVDAATWTGKAARETRETVVASGGYAILSGDQSAVDGMEVALRAHSVASELLVAASGGWEVSVFSEVDGVPSKCRFDRLLDAGVGVDLKTTKAGPGSYQLTRAVLDYGYEIQEAHYRAVAQAAGIELERFVFIFAQNCEPFHVTVVDLDASFLERGQALRSLALSRLLHPEFEPSYPGQYEPVTLNLPRWAEL